MHGEPTRMQDDERMGPKTEYITYHTVMWQLIALLSIMATENIS